MASTGRKRRGATAAAEAGIALAMIFLMLVSGIVGFGIGRHTGGGSKSEAVATSQTEQETVTTSGGGGGEAATTSTQAETTEMPAPTTTEDKGGGGGAGSAAKGKTIFASAGCGSCHTLRAAGSSGNVGPNLDEAKPSFDKAVERVTEGKPPMPSFKGQLTDQQIRDVAQFVSSSTRG